MSAATEIRTVKVKEGEVTYDPDMEMGVLKALLNAGEDGDLEVMQTSMGKMIIEWPYKGDPKKIPSWDKLRRSQFIELSGAVMEDLGSLGEE